MLFQYYLEPYIGQLHNDLLSGAYKHGKYTYFTVQDSKRRDIAVATVRDRVVHRLIYDHLIPVWDKTFIFDAWSCRNDKGQHKAIERAAVFMQDRNNSWVWRADITKFFDSVDQKTLFDSIKRRATCPEAMWLIDEVITSYHKNEPGRGMPIGNLTSQIFANIYLNEFDRFMVHTLKPKAYLRYGDDWLCFTESKTDALFIRNAAEQFLFESLNLQLTYHLTP